MARQFPTRSIWVAFISTWGTVGILLALVEGQSTDPLLRLRDPLGGRKWVPNPSGLRIPPSINSYTVNSRLELFGFHILRGINVTGIIVPWWFLFRCMAVMPARWLVLAVGYWRVRNRMEQGRCPNCGYDLRASPDRCPECGTTVPTLDAK